MISEYAKRINKLTNKFRVKRTLKVWDSRLIRVYECPECELHHQCIDRLMTREGELCLKRSSSIESIFLAMDRDIRPMVEVGAQYGLLKVIKKIDKNNNKYRRTKWLCKCICGKETCVFGYNLLNGNSKSCGCQRGSIKAKK